MASLEVNVKVTGIPEFKAFCNEIAAIFEDPTCPLSLKLRVQEAVRRIQFKEEG